MLAILLLLAAAPAEDLASRLRHLESAAAAWAPAPSPDGTRVAFLTTLFGTRQAASMAAEGGYPLQLTDEPNGVESVRYVPADPTKLVVVALREGRRRILVVDEEGTRPEPLDAAKGDQLVGGFARDGKRLFYAVVEGNDASLRTASVDTGKSSEVVPPPASAGVAPPASFPVELGEALKGMTSLGPPAPDGRSIVATVLRGSGEALVLVDIASARAALLTPGEKPARIRSPRFTRDSRTLYFLTDAGRKTMGLESIALPGRARKTVFVPPQDIDAFALTEDGHRLAVATESGGEDIFSLLELPSLRPQPLAAPPAGALAESEVPLTWDRAGERLFFGWRLPDDTTDLWQLRFGYGTAVRLTRSPRPGLPRDAIPRPAVVRLGSTQGWLWKPADEQKPRLAILVSREARPVFDKRIAALNFDGLAVLAVEQGDDVGAALQFARSSKDLDAREPLLLNLDGAEVKDASQFSGIVGPGKDAGLQLDPDQPDLNALVKYARRAAK